jgi:hypothetical protein
VPVPPNRSKRALAPLERRTHSFPLARDADPGAAERVVRGGGSILTLPSGSIAGDVRAVAVDRRRKTVTYELRVVNETASPLATFAYSADDATTDELTWSSIMVPARSSIALPIEMGLVRGNAVPRLIVQVFAERAALTIDGEPPPAQPRGNARGGGLALIAAALIGMAGVGYAAERPNVVTLAAPTTVEAGRAFAVAYALGSTRRAHYVVERADGLEVGGGVLSGPNGTFAVTLPPGVAGGYDLVLETSSPLGRAERVAHVAAELPASEVALDPRHRARIAAFALDRDEVNAGESFAVSYRSNARAGTLKILDQDGTVRAEALVSRRGASTLLAPLVDRDQDMRVVLEVERGASRAEASAPLLVRAATPSTLAGTVADWASRVRGTLDARLPVAPRSAPATLAEDGGANPVGVSRSIDGITVDIGGTPLAGDGDGPLTFPRAAYHSGQTIDLGVRYEEASLHVMLQDAGGAPLAERDIPAGTSAIHLTAPPTVQPTRLLIVTTYARGIGRETLVHPLTILPPG